MNNSRCMGGIHCVGNLNGERQQHIAFQGPPADLVLQHYAFQILHGNKALPSCNPMS